MLAVLLSIPALLTSPRRTSPHRATVATDRQPRAYRAFAAAAALAIMLGAMTLPASAQPAPRGPFAHPAMAEWRRDVSLRINRKARLLGRLSVRGDTLIGLRVERNGRLVDSKVIKSSGDSELDGAFLAVVRTASPFAPLPAVYPGALLSFTTTMTSDRRKGDFNGMKPLRPYQADF